MSPTTLVPEKKKNEPWFEMYKASFVDNPVPTERGLNKGVLLMNLTRMREYNFEDKIIKLYKSYLIPVNKNDQSLLNILLFLNPYLLHLMPCQYNFRPTACSRGFYCGAVLDDPTGIQIIHQYTKSSDGDITNAFRDIAEAYQRITEPNVDFRHVLLIKVRDMYKDNFSSTYNHGQCNDVVNSFLYKRFLL